MSHAEEIVAAFEAHPNAGVRRSAAKWSIAHIHAIALYFVFYNFCRVHETLRTSPAMAAGVSKTLWSLEDVIAKIDEMAPEPKARGPYKSGTPNLLQLFPPSRAGE